MPSRASLSAACLLLLGGCGPEYLLVPLPPPANPRVGWYVDAAGSSDASGGPASPWDLMTALHGGHGRVQPGDTIWLRQGLYGGSFSVAVAGAPGAPIVVRPFPGERAAIDGAGTSSSTLIVDASWVVVWGLELFNSNRDRNSPRPDVVLNNASHTKFVNLVIHDGGVALYSGRAQSDVEISGCIIYDNGWQESDRGHGHAIYVKSDVGPVLISGNVLFNQFGFGVHAFSDPGEGHINGVTIDRNVAFGNGTLSSNSTSANLLAGGWDGADSLTVSNNLTFFASGTGGINSELGYDTVLNGAMTVRGNYIVGGSRVLDVGSWTSAAVAQNTVVGDSVVAITRDSASQARAWTQNQYFRDPTASAWMLRALPLAFQQWRAATGLGTTDSALAGRPAATTVFVLPNRYEAGRAFVVVYNWGGGGSASADLTGVLAPGDSFAVRNVQDLFGVPVSGGTFAGGSIGIPLGGVAPPVPVGMGSSPASRTGPLFDVFLVSRAVP